MFPATLVWVLVVRVNRLNLQKQIELISVDTGEISSTATVTVNPTVTLPPSSSSSTATSLAVLPPVVFPSGSTSQTTVASITTSEATKSSSPSISTTASTRPAPVLPVRPISGTASTSVTATGPTTTVSATQCPTGFYQCSAYYHAGCCQVGRDCGLTSCPGQSSTLAINSNGVTISEAAGPTATGLGENGCALGWFSCAAAQGGGCCPSGYACGTSCTATAVVVQGGATGTAKVAKDNTGQKVGAGGWQMGIAVLTLSFVLGI